MIIIITYAIPSKFFLSLGQPGDRQIEPREDGACSGASRDQNRARLQRLHALA